MSKKKNHSSRPFTCMVEWMNHVDDADDYYCKKKGLKFFPPSPIYAYAMVE